jgi:hypothetical protein
MTEIIEAHEIEGHGFYWELTDPDRRCISLSNGDQWDDSYIATVDTFEQVLEIAKERKAILKVFTQEWAESKGLL